MIRTGFDGYGCAATGAASVTTRGAARAISRCRNLFSLRLAAVARPLRASERNRHAVLTPIDRSLVDRGHFDDQAFAQARDVHLRRNMAYHEASRPCLLRYACHL